MIRFALSYSDWETSKKYWKELKKQFIGPDDAKKADFLNRALFESSRTNESGHVAHASTTTRRTSAMRMLSEIIDKIDTEITIDEKNDVKIDTDIDSDVDIKTPECIN